MWLPEDSGPRVRLWEHTFMWLIICKLQGMSNIFSLCSEWFVCHVLKKEKENKKYLFRSVNIFNNHNINYYIIFNNTCNSYYYYYSNINGCILRSQKTPKLLAGPSNGLFLQFGGQGVPYLDELRNIYSLYPSSHAFFNLAANVLREEMRNNADLVFYLHGLEFLQWIKGPQSEAPPEEYLMSSPIR